MKAESKSQVTRFRAQSERYDAGYKAGYEAGLRRAGEICQLYAGDQRRHSLCTSAAFKCKDAILAAIWEKHD